jgi:hypothetical protein
MILTCQSEGSFETYQTIIAEIFGPETEKQSLIDLCCGECTMSRNYPFKTKLYVDILEWPTMPPETRKTFVQTDVLGDHEIFNRKYDVANCSDGIEHFARNKGLELIARMELISSKQVFFTPIGPLWLHPESDTDPTSHKSFWYPSDLPTYAHIELPNYHPLLGCGAFFFWHCEDIEKDFNRVSSALKAKLPCAE